MKKDKEEKENGRVLRSELEYGYASRSFTLSSAVDGHPAAPFHHHTGGSTMKILIPVDQSDAARHAIEHTVRLAQNVGGVDVILLNVRNGPELHGELSPLDYQALDRAQREAQQNLLARALEHAQRVGLTRVSIDAAQGVPAEEIVRAAQEKGVDQIVMGTHGRSAMGRFLLGSVAQRVLHLAPMPVTAVK
jgi:nucleotide-binding universal stress UspA family protein